MKRESFYVVASHGPGSITVLTSDREQLREAVVRFGAHRSASELARKAGSNPSPALASMLGSTDV